SLRSLKCYIAREVYTLLRKQNRQINSTQITSRQSKGVRGDQYCSADYQALLKRYNLRGSVSAKGCCYDNACVESFFHSLKVASIHGEHFISRAIIRATMFNYIECDYKRWRRHSRCGGFTPEQFEN
ncbi:TPA: IS3 family transposase, partial [Escherichia coli]